MLRFIYILHFLPELRTNVSEEIIMCIVGNKADLEQARKISTDQGSEYASSVRRL